MKTEKEYKNGDLEFSTDYQIKPAFRFHDLVGRPIYLYANQGNFTIRCEGSFVKDPDMTVGVWESKEGIDKLLLEKRYNKIEHVIDIITDLPFDHPIEKALYVLLDEYNARFK